MIKFEKTETYGWESAIRGMRNPLNSWDKSDSKYCRQSFYPTEYCEKCGWFKNEYCLNSYQNPYVVGENDLNLMQRLCKAGSDHGKFLRMVNITVDITAPLYWWKEYDTYKVGTVTNSCSTMHKIHAKEFELSDFSCEHLSETNKNTVLKRLIDGLNYERERFVETKDKQYWWQMIQLLPSSYNQKRTVQLNYQVLLNMYRSRKNHKLDEWHDFCDWIESLPYFKEICLGGENND